MTKSPRNTNVAKLVTRMGFIVAGADGLSTEENQALMEFAVQRSGLPQQEVDKQRVLAAKGLDALEEADIAELKTLPRKQLSSLLREVVEKTAKADGQISIEEEQRLKQLWSKLTA